MVATTRHCTRCRARCVVGATYLCLACGHELRPQNDRIESSNTVWRDTVVLPAEFGTTDDEDDEGRSA